MSGRQKMALRSAKRHKTEREHIKARLALRRLLEQQSHEWAAQLEGMRRYTAFIKEAVAAKEAATARKSMWVW